MKVGLSSLYSGVRSARGTTVVVDVYRAFTCAPLLLSYGVESSILVSSAEEALALKREDPARIVVGEIGGVPVEGFDLGNSPSSIMKLGPQCFKGKTVVQRTSSGVQGALAALEAAEEVLLAGYCTARATAQYIRSRSPEQVSIVAMGWEMTERAPEDEWCARYIAHLLGFGDYDHDEALREILFDESTQKFLRGDKTYFPAEDPVLCLQRDIFDFALRASRHGKYVVACRIGAEDSRGGTQQKGDSPA